MTDKTILVIGTYDTKEDELRYIADRIRTQGIEEWDKPGEPAHDPDGLKAFRRNIPALT